MFRSLVFGAIVFATAHPAFGCSSCDGAHVAAADGSLIEDERPVQSGLEEPSAVSGPATSAHEPGADEPEPGSHDTKRLPLGIKAMLLFLKAAADGGAR